MSKTFTDPSGDRLSVSSRTNFSMIKVFDNCTKYLSIIALTKAQTKEFITELQAIEKKLK